MALGLFLVQATINGENILTLPFLNFTCLAANGFTTDQNSITLEVYQGYYEQEAFRNLTLITLDPITGNAEDDGSVQATTGLCFDEEAVCK